MWVHLKNGRSFYFAAATEISETEDGETRVTGKRGRWISSFRTDAVACYFSGNEDVTTFGFRSLCRLLGVTLKEGE